MIAVPGGLLLRFAGNPVVPVVIGMALNKTIEGKLRQGISSW